jgi:N-acyl-D-amino-acid deacylase
MMQFDIIIRGGEVLDGLGSEAVRKDIGINRKKIVALDDLTSAVSDQVIDATGLMVAPGFIDTHSHSDLALFEEPSNWNKLIQGITTDLEGMCGLSLAPVPAGKGNVIREVMPFLPRTILNRIEDFRDFQHLFSMYDDITPGTNIGVYAGHGNIRGAVLGVQNVQPTGKQLDQMRGLMEEAMQAGALGVSYGLIYPPGVFSQKEELSAMAELAAKYGGGFTIHLRSEGKYLIESVQEALDIVRETGVYAILSHHKAAGKANWGKVEKTLQMIEEINREGYRVGLDVYPYLASATSLKTLIPSELHAQGIQSLLVELQTETGKKRIKDYMLSGQSKGETQFENAGFSGTMIIDSPTHPETHGKTLYQLAEEEDRDPFDVLAQLLIDDQSATMAAYFMMCEEDLVRILKHPLSMVGTDGGVMLPNEGAAPRTIGTFPRVLGEYIREKQIMALPEMIRKMTSLPAKLVGLEDRGSILVGNYADIVVFDPETIQDQATFVAYDRPNIGIHAVLVNGEIVVENDRYLGKSRAGVVLKNENGVVK